MVRSTPTATASAAAITAAAVCWSIAPTITTAATHSASAAASVLRGGADSAESSSPNASNPTATTPLTDDDKNNVKKNKSKKKKHHNNKSTSTASTSSLPIVDEILALDDYYQILGLTREQVQQQQQQQQQRPGSKQPTEEQQNKMLQKAYRKRAVLCHPDKTNGDRRAFDKVAQAYEVLSDPVKRKQYDRYGKAGVSSNNGGNGSSGGRGYSSAEDLFQSFFGGTASPFSSFGQQYYSSQPQQRQQQQQNRSMRFELEVSLEDLYQGKAMTVLLPLQSRTSNAKKKEIPIHIPRGAFHNEQILASGVVDSDPSQPPGDVFFSLKQRAHETFTRKGHDLAVVVEISLAEAVASGVFRSIRHLDGRVIPIVSASSSSSTKRNDSPAVISTGDVQVLKGAGMPKDALGTEFGDLYVQFQVAMPEESKRPSSLTLSERQELFRLLQKLEGERSSSTTTGPSNHFQPWPFLASAKDAKILQSASLSDFGKSFRQQQEQQHQQNSPLGGFGQHSQSFSWSSSSGGNPFFGSAGPHNGEDLGETQCHQM